jgi:hypothetical protein
MYNWKAGKGIGTWALFKDGELILESFWKRTADKELLEEIARSLNATEQLSAVNAEMAADFIKSEEGYKWTGDEVDYSWNLHEEFDALQAYASALEGRKTNIIAPNTSWIEDGTNTTVSGAE